MSRSPQDSPPKETASTFAEILSGLTNDERRAWIHLVEYVAGFDPPGSGPSPEERVPDTLLVDADNREVRLSDLWRRHPLALSFSLGEKCPFSRIENHALRQAAAALQPRGGIVVRLLPNLESFSPDLADEDGYLRLCDVHGALALATGQALPIDDHIRTLAQSIPWFPATTGMEPLRHMPLPGCLVIDRTGRIVARESYPDLSVRPDPGKMVAILNGLSRSEPQT